MRSVIVLCVTLLPAFAQEVTWLGEHTGRAVSDAQGNWFTVESIVRGGDRDLRVRRLSPDLRTTLWSRDAGGTGSEEVRALRATADGLLVLGNTTSRDFPVTGGVLAATPPPSPPSAFLIMFGPAGELVFSTYLHDGNSTSAEGLLEVRSGEITLAISGRLWRIDSHASRRTGEVASRWIGGSLAMSAGGKLWVAGTAYADDLPVTAGAFQTSRQSGTCFSFIGPIACSTGFILRMDPFTGAIEAATYLGGESPAVITGIGIAPDGGPVVAGNVLGSSAGFPTTPGSFQPAVSIRGFSPWFTSRPLSTSTPFVARLTPDLDRLVYSTWLAGSRAERATWLAVDGDGQAIIAGDTVSRDFPGAGAFARPCGPDPGSNAPSSAFVTRLSADGSALAGSAVLAGSSLGIPFADEDGSVIAAGSRGLARVTLDSADRAVVACTVNGASFRPESYLAAGQLLTLIGAGFAEDARLLFDDVQAQLLYLAPDQINAVVPQDVRGRESVQVVLEVGGQRSDAGSFEIRPSNPTVKVFVRPDGTLEDRGNPLADVRLNGGAQNGTQNPARHGEIVELYATGLDVSQPVELFLPDHRASPADVVSTEDTGYGVQKIRVRIPEDASRGVVTIAIVNAGRSTAPNAGFVWVE